MARRPERPGARTEPELLGVLGSPSPGASPEVLQPPFTRSGGAVPRGAPASPSPAVGRPGLERDGVCQEQGDGNGCSDLPTLRQLRGEGPTGRVSLRLASPPCCLSASVILTPSRPADCSPEAHLAGLQPWVGAPRPRAALGASRCRVSSSCRLQGGSAQAGPTWPFPPGRGACHRGCRHPTRPPARRSRAQPSPARLATVTPAPGRAEHITRLLAKSSAQIWGLWKEMGAQRKRISD